MVRNVRVAAASDLPVGAVLGVEVEGRAHALWRRSDGRPVLVDDQCVHQGASLAEGWVEEDRLVCPLHQWAFDDAGNCVHIPANRDGVPIPDQVRVATLACHEVDGQVVAVLADPPPHETAA